MEHNLDDHTTHNVMARHSTAQHGNVEANQDTATTHQDRRQAAEHPSEIHENAEHIYTLSVPQVRKMLVDAGHIVSERTLIRWCAKELIDAALRPEENGQYEKYYVTEASVLKKIDQLDRVKPTAIQPESLRRHTETTPSSVENDRVNLGSDQGSATSADDMSRLNFAQKDSKKVEPSLRGLRKQVQELKDQLLMKTVDIQIKEQLLIREREVTREAWDKIAEVGERVGKWKVKYEKLELASATEPKTERQADEHFPHEIRESATSHQMDVVEVAKSVNDSAKSEDDLSDPNLNKLRERGAGIFLRYTVYVTIFASMILVSLAFI
tara:strand:+ start:244 stop:1218 length:975 start_codon:yes stop_codon:yes gene_type:complete